MNKLLQRIVMAYRPLYLHGLLLDGQYRLPKTPSPDAAVATRGGRRNLLAALSWRVSFHPRGSGGRDDGLSASAGVLHR